MKKLRQEMTAFFRDVYEGENKILVFGEGSLKAELMLIGEAPGEKETLEGRPFVGKAGKNLDEFLEISGFSRDKIYITNTVKFRPVKISNAGRYVNRPPSREEIELSLPWLLKEIALVNPRLIVSLGNVPLKALLGTKAVVGQMRGRFHTAMGYALFPMYHPASLIYNPSLRPIYHEDVMKLKQWREERER